MKKRLCPLSSGQVGASSGKCHRMYTAWSYQRELEDMPCSALTTAALERTSQAMLLANGILMPSTVSPMQSTRPGTITLNTHLPSPPGVANVPRLRLDRMRRRSRYTHMRPPPARLSGLWWWYDAPRQTMGTLSHVKHRRARTMKKRLVGIRETCLKAEFPSAFT